MLQPPTQAPLDIPLLDETGQPATLRQLLGKWLVLYFYPKDNTPGCTQEACEFQDANQALQQLGVTVIGVSKDNLKSHAKFREQYHLAFPLWSDPDHALLEAFGAWGEKKFMGRVFMGILRSTFIINPSGQIVKVWEKVSPKDHAAEVLAFLQTELAKA